MKKLSFLFFVFLLLFAFRSIAQPNLKDSIVSAPLFCFSYGFQLPAGDMKDRFGFNSSAGADMLFKTKKNWLFGIDFHYIFGTDVKDNHILDGMKTKEGEIIGQDGQYADVAIFERGYTTCAKVGKLFPVGKPNRNSGIVFTTGMGFMQHKIRIDVVNNTVPQLTTETKKGYDRLTNGFMIEHFLGYKYLGNKRLLNFYGGFEVTYAFTQNRRAYNWDTMQRDTQKRIDVLYGIRLGWMIPFYKRAGKTYYE